MIWFFGFLSFLGFTDALYLTVKHFQEIIPPCTVLTGCETVLTSSYAVVWGVPVALMGAGYYLALLLLTILYLDRQKKSALSLAINLTWAGFGASLWFVGLQVFVLKAYCLYCLLSALISFILFLLGRIIGRKKDKTHI